MNLQPGLKNPWITGVAWCVFILSCGGVLCWAIIIAHAAQLPIVSTEVSGPERRRFGKSETERQHLFQALVQGESAERMAAEKQSETAIWNRNHDDYFHQTEWFRLHGRSLALGIPLWLAFLILDEGMREHWPLPPNEELRCDDAPLLRHTRPYAQRPVISRLSPP